MKGVQIEMKKAFSIILLISILFAFSACKKVQDNTSNFPVEIEFSGNYLMNSIELSEDESIIKSISLSENNLSELKIKEKQVIGSLSIYEAEVIWDLNNKCFYLDKGYDIGQEKIAFSNTGLTLVQSLDTYDISFLINGDEWKFKDFKVYNFKCTYSSKEYDSYFLYKQGNLYQITVDDLEYNQVNCVYENDCLYLATFVNIDSEEKPIFENFGDPIAFRNEY